MRPAPSHSDAAHQAITAELVACCLGQRDRPELRKDHTFDLWLTRHRRS